jgi:hypothetical protein
MGVVVLAVELLFDALLELLEDLFERLLFFAERHDFRFFVQLGLELGREIEEVIFVGEQVLLGRRGFEDRTGRRHRDRSGSGRRWWWRRRRRGGDGGEQRPRHRRNR